MSLRTHASFATGVRSQSRRFMGSTKVVAGVGLSSTDVTTSSPPGSMRAVRAGTPAANLTWFMPTRPSSSPLGLSVSHAADAEAMASSRNVCLSKKLSKVMFLAMSVLAVSFCPNLVIILYGVLSVYVTYSSKARVLANRSKPSRSGMY
eukprot:scaffold7828_cov70-Phaeocystis_antarctica.AAC.3